MRENAAAQGYRIKIMNTINFKKSHHYNPFSYIHSEKDILKLVNCLIVNTKGEGGKSGDDFWLKAETLLIRRSSLYPLRGPGGGAELLHAAGDDKRHGGPGGRRGI